MIRNIHAKKKPIPPMSLSEAMALSSGEGLNFMDGYGRFHQKPVTRNNPYPGNNAFLFSGYAYLVGLLDNRLSVIECWSKCLTAFGYDRHPNGDPFPASSHDELVGMFMLSERRHAKILLGWAQDRDYTICNFATYAPVPWYKRLNPFKIIRDFWRLSREENPRTSTYKYPYIWPIVFKHPPEHVYFYHRCAGVSPGLYLTLRFHLASIYTYFFGGVSGRTMLGFKLLKLKELGYTEYEEELADYLFKDHNFPQIVEQYFLPYTNHPIVLALQSDKTLAQ